MFSARKRKLILATTSAFVSLVVLAAGYEAFRGYRYDRWKAEFDESQHWSENLTVPSGNEVLMWEYRPNYQYVDPQTDVVITTNRFGFRDAGGRTLEKPGGLLRIAFIGDSVTLGQAVSDEATLVRRFEEHAERLSESKVEALNFGVGGYNSLQILELLRTRVVDFDPDIVVYVMCLNDFNFDDAAGGLIRYFRRPRSFLLGALETAYQRVLGKDYHVYYFEKHKTEALEAVVEMRDILRARSIGFRVALVPVFRTSQESFEDYDLASLHRIIDEELRGEGIHVSDLLSAFEEDGKPPTWYAHDVWHPNENGNDLIGRSLAGPILEQ